MYSKLRKYSLPVLLACGTLLAAGCTGTPPRLGIMNGRLVNCPESPNCVSSQATDPEHRIEPFRYDDAREEAKKRLRKAIDSVPRSRFVENQDRYWRVEFTSFFFRFVDDGEFFFDPERKVIEVRSASRKGSSDFGVNRKRLEQIRAGFEATRSRPEG